MSSFRKVCQFVGSVKKDPSIRVYISEGAILIWELSTGGKWIDVIPTMSFLRLLDPPRAPLKPRALGFLPSGPLPGSSAAAPVSGRLHTAAR